MEIAIFEPWGLGDLTIVLHAARSLRASGYNVTIICNPAFAEFVETEKAVHRVIPFYAPWTKPSQKYLPWRYSLKDFIALKRKLHQLNISTVCELRGDFRNLILFKWLNLPKSICLIGQSFSNRYDRASMLCKKLNSAPPLMHSAPVKTTSKVIACFFGAEWKNRQVPLEKASQILDELMKRNFSVLLILQPDDILVDWQDRNQDFIQTGRLEMIQDSIPAVLSKLHNVRICISTDSGWMHIAHYLGIRTIGLFGFRNDSEWSPPNCKVIFSQKTYPAQLRYKLHAKSLKPLESLLTQEVCAALDEQINKA